FVCGCPLYLLSFPTRRSSDLDRPRATSAAGLAALRAAGVGTIAMMTGDRRSVGLRIAAELELEAKDVHADLLPKDKVRLVGELADRKSTRLNSSHVKISYAVF